jgi:sulfite exporter TauE/SafE
MFALGLGTSLHCVSMCGPLVLTYAIKGEEDGPWYRKLTPNVVYQGAKLVSYMLVGLLLGAVGAFFDLNAIRPYVYYVAGVFMIVLGLGMTGRFPWAARLTPRPPKWLMNSLLKLRRKSVADAKEGHSTLATPITFGLMTGLLPCGPLMAAQIAAAASGSAFTGAFGMAAFAAGTAPLMIAFGTAGSLIPRVWKDRMMVVLAVGVMIFGLVFINRGLVATGAPVTFMTVKTAALGTGSAAGEYQTAADGVVEVPISIINTSFVPQVVEIPADTPVRLVVDRQEDVACSDQIYLPQLNILQDLAPNGVTTVDIPATAAGAYTLTCGMSMMQGQLLVGESGGGGLGGPILWLGLAAVATGGVFYVARGRSKRDASAKASSASAGKGTKGAKEPVDTTRATNVPEQPDAVRILGFTPAEAILIVAAVAAAIIAGLALGGMFS